MTKEPLDYEPNLPFAEPITGGWKGAAVIAFWVGGLLAFMFLMFLAGA